MNLHKLTKLSLSLLVLLVLSPTLCNGQDVGQTMKSIFGNDYKGYQWFTYPINNFGVATAYRGKKNKIERRGFLCATFSCLGMSAPGNVDHWLQLGVPPSNYADSGCGGELDAKLQSSKDLIVKAALPQILTVIGIDVGVARSRNSTAEAKSITMCARQLQQGKVITYITSLATDTFGLRRALDAGQLVLVVGDIVIKSMTVHVKADRNLKVGIDGKLQGQTEKVLGGGANFGVHVTRTGESEYDLKITEPVIAGILAVRENTLGTSGIPVRPEAISPWRGWNSVTLPLPAQRARR